MKLILLAFLFQPFSITIRCDVDGRIERISGERGYSANLLSCPRKHNICDRHAQFDRHGHVRCPIDGWVKP